MAVAMVIREDIVEVTVLLKKLFSARYAPDDERTSENLQDQLPVVLGGA